MDDVVESIPVAPNPAEPAMPPNAEFLRGFLAGRDIACPVCKYSLRDLVGDRCPECGDQITLAVNPVEPKQAAAITGLILLAAGGGLNGLLLIYWAFDIFRRGVPHGATIDRFFYVNAGGAIVEGAAIFVWLTNWSKIRRLPPSSRWVLATAFCGFLTIADLVIFIKIIR